MMTAHYATEKRCIECGDTKPRAAFPLYVTGRRAGTVKSARCRPCDNRRWKKPIEQRRHRFRVRADAVRDVIAAALSVGCRDCGERDIVVLEFDHRDPSLKEFGIARAAHTGRSLPRVQREIAKCDVVCANCHRRRTYRRANSWRTRLTERRKATLPAEAEKVA